MNQEQSPRWRLIRRVRVSAWIAGGSILVLVLILIGSAFGKTLWDWLQLLIVPLVLALGGYWFNWGQKQRQDTIEDRRAQDTALQSYLDHMSQLLIDKQGTELQQLKPNSEVRRLMTARTTTVLNNLDTGRKQTVIRYLAEANLIADESPVIMLEGTDLRHLNLSGLDLSKGNLANADLRGANLGGTILRGTDLHGANLSVADDDGYTVSNLRGANLSVADDLTPTNLRGAKLRGANLGPPDQGEVTNLTGAILDSADLSPGENGNVTNLTNAILTNATLLDTNLKDAVLYLANLSDAKLTNKQGFQHRLDKWTDDVNSVAAMVQQQPPPPKPELLEAKGLTQKQLDQSRGNKEMELPNGLKLPDSWSKPLLDQKRSLKEQHIAR